MGRPASIPSPSSGSIDIFGLSIHAYGLMIASGVLLAVWLTGRRLERAGAGTKDDVSSMAMWAVAAGVVGARLYYIVTDKSQPWKEPSRWLKIWEGGLGIPGGLLAGVLVGMWATRRRGVSVAAMFTAAAPAIPLAQAVGRLGNWWNQELFGRPTTLPWGLEIDDAHLPEGYASGTLFHPTFLYEALWNVALAGALILIERKVKLKPGRLLAVYVAGYAAGRFWVEGLRIDPANAGGGWRLNQWTAVVAFVLAVAFLVWDWRRPAPVAAAGADDSDMPADEDNPDTPAAEQDDYVPEDD
ncbi:MAG: prolipoprotein diacylglyceryl transferase [Ilumatobacteraceae bacterium]|nr:prolipoprotein diacylglyceryl transferase [Ilumatobacter sp.]